MLKKSEILHQKQVDHVYSEYKILSVLNQPFIVELKGVNVNDPVYLYFILQYVPGGELFSLLRSKVSFPLLQAKFYIAHIVTIFEYLHSKNIIYRDLKPEIIMNKGHGKPVDWWTMGVLLYEMLVGIDPFNDEDPMMIYQKIIKGKVYYPNSMDRDAKSLIKHLLTEDTTKRFG